MVVELTSEALGKAVGATHTGPEEAWLLANGYAKQTGYTGPGVSNTGPAVQSVANDVVLAANREAPVEAGEDWDTAYLPLDPNMGGSDFAGYDFDAGNVNTEPPNIISLSDTSGPLAGGETISLEGDQLEGVTAVTFGGVNAPTFEVVSDVEIEVTVPAGTAGAKSVSVTSPAGTDTLAAAYTYA